MNGDLERTLGELGPGYRAVVDRLRAARDMDPSLGRVFAPPRPWWRRRVGYLVAASLFVVLALSLFCRDASHSPRQPYTGAKIYTVAYAPTEEALEIIVASQKADGSWSNDFLTRQNAAALRASGDERMRIAYRRAVRYLRTKGLSPLTDDELKLRGEYAAKVLAGA